jgi:hypothetical protein
MKVVIVGNQLLEYSVFHAALEPRIGVLIRAAGGSCRARKCTQKQLQFYSRYRLWTPKQL